MPSCQGMEEAQLSFAKHLGVPKTSSLPNATGESLSIIFLDELSLF